MSVRLYYIVETQHAVKPTRSTLLQHKCRRISRQHLKVTPENRSTSFPRRRTTNELSIYQQDVQNYKNNSVLVFICDDRRNMNEETIREKNISK